MKKAWIDCIEVFRNTAYRLGILFCCGFMGFSPSLSYSAEPSSRFVDVGVYLNNIPSVSLKEKNFQADFYIWFRWTGEDIDPLENFEIINGHIDSKDALVKKKIGNVNYGSCRVAATIYRNFDLSRYPLDNHTLKIQVEDAQFGSDVMLYRPDKANTSINQKISVPGWAIGELDSYASVTTYPTNYGDISLSNNAESRFPRYTFAVDLERGGYGNFIKLFSMLFLAAALSSCVFMIRPDHIDTRLALHVSGVFLAAITQSALVANLPESDSFGMADMLYNTTMTYIFLTFLVSIYTYNIFLGGNESKASKLSRLFGILLSTGYLLANFVIIR